VRARPRISRYANGLRETAYCNRCRRTRTCGTLKTGMHAKASAGINWFGALTAARTSLNGTNACTDRGTRIASSRRKANRREHISCWQNIVSWLERRFV
jgi:hypothetical protein